MLRTRPASLVAAFIASLSMLAGLGLPAGADSSLIVSSTCTGGSGVSLRLSFTDDPAHPSALPAAWVGYDIYRRTFPDGECVFPGERINDEILLRPPQDHELTYLDAPRPGSHAYTAVFVDADRRPIRILSCPRCDLTNDFYGATGYAACPREDVVVTIGSIIDLGWALRIQACSEGCWPAALSDPIHDDELRPLADSGAILQFYGSIECCLFWHPVISIDRYEIGPCIRTPTARTSWGQLKAIYR